MSLNVTLSAQCQLTRSFHCSKGVCKWRTYPFVTFSFRSFLSLTLAKKTKSCITVFTCRLWFAYIALLQGTNHKMKAQVCFTALSPSHSSVEGAIQFPCFVLGGYNNVNAISISAAIKSTLIYRLIGVSRRAPQTMGIWGTLNLGGKGIAMVARGVTLLSLGSARRL